MAAVGTDDIEQSIAQALEDNGEVHGEEGRYELGECFHNGVTGDVYRCTLVSSGRPLSAKIGHSVPQGVDGRYTREIAFMRTARHPNVVRLFDEVTTADGRVGWVFEVGEPKTLRRVLDSAGYLPPETEVRVGLQIARALNYVHGMSLVHRDVKPGHLIWEGSPEHPLVKFMDFGLVGPVRSQPPAPSNRLAANFNRLTSAETILGTPTYMAPEQIKGQPTDSRSDVYSWGVTMYEMLAGYLPFNGQGVELLQQHLRSEPQPILPSRAPAALNDLIMRSMAKEPQQRPSAELLVAELID